MRNTRSTSRESTQLPDSPRPAGTDEPHAADIPGAARRVLRFMRSDRSRQRTAESAGEDHDGTERAALRTALETAQEEIAFLREQLRSAERFFEHELEAERVRLRTFRDRLARELVAFTEGLECQAWMNDVVDPRDGLPSGGDAVPAEPARGS